MNEFQRPARRPITPRAEEDASQQARRKGRGRFFNAEKMPADRSFWVFFAEKYLPPDMQPTPEEFKVLREWQPDRSNCPELATVVEDLIRKMPREWRLLADQLFVGRALSGEVNATAETSKQARIVTINLQFTTILYAYAHAYDDLTSGLRRLYESFAAHADDIGEQVGALEAALATQWESIEQHRAAWLDPSEIVGLTRELQVLPGEDRSDAQEFAVLAAERWIVAHEVAHHLLGHTVSRARGLPARDLVDAYWDVIDDLIDMTALNQSQRREVAADALAFLRIAQAYDPRASVDARHLYQAQIGAVLGLVGLTHVTDEWVTRHGRDETHPGFDIRYRIVAGLTDKLGRALDRGPLGDHPLDLAIDLETFASVAFDAARVRHGLGRREALSVLEILDSMIDDKVALARDIGPPQRGLTADPSS